jgi:hypothetical protein
MKGKRKMADRGTGPKKGTVVGKKTGMKKARAQMDQHDNATKAKGATGGPKGYKKRLAGASL